MASGAVRIEGIDGVLAWPDDRAWPPPELMYAHVKDDVVVCADYEKADAEDAWRRGARLYRRANYSMFTDPEAPLVRSAEYREVEPDA